MASPRAWAIMEQLSGVIPPSWRAWTSKDPSVITPPATSPGSAAPTAPLVTQPLGLNDWYDQNYMKFGGIREGSTQHYDEYNKYRKSLGLDPIYQFGQAPKSSANQKIGLLRSS